MIAVIDAVGAEEADTLKIIGETWLSRSRLAGRATAGATAVLVNFRMLLLC